MSKRKSLVPLLVLSLILVLPVAVLADEPDIDECFPNCYAHHRAPAKTDEDGTYYAPIVVPAEADRTALRKQIGARAKEEEESALLTIINCDAQGKCSYIEYTYDDKGKEKSKSKKGFPEPGAWMPAPYMLGIGVLLAAVLIGVGIALRPRVRLGRA